MIIRPIIIVFLFVFTSSCIWSQGWRLNLLQGIGQHKEELIQPITYSGYKVGLGVSYDNETRSKNILFADFITSGIITADTKLGNDMSLLNVNLELGYLLATKTTQWSSGASIQSQYDYALYALNYEYPFWFTQYSLNWNNKFQIINNDKYQLSITASIPLVGLFSRTEKQVFYENKENYNRAYLHQGMTVGSLNDFQGITCRIDFFKKRIEKTDFGIAYRLSYFNYEKPKQISSTYHAMVLSLKFKSKNED